MEAKGTRLALASSSTGSGHISRSWLVVNFCKNIFIWKEFFWGLDYTGDFGWAVFMRFVKAPLKAVMNEFPEGRPAEFVVELSLNKFSGVLKDL